MNRIVMYSLCSVFDALKMLSLATACAAVSFLFDSFDEDSSVKSTDFGLCFLQTKFDCYFIFLSNLNHDFLATILEKL